MFLGRFVCPQCSKSYKHKRHLTSHLTYECFKEPKLECPICLKKFHQRYALNAHEKRLHGKDIATPISPFRYSS